VFSIPASGGAERQVTDGSGIVGAPAPTPDGTALLFARTVGGASATEVVHFALSDGKIGVVSSAEDSEPAISPDGRRLAVRSFRYADGSGDVVAVDASDGSHPIRVTASGASDGAPCFAPVPP
jgi:Tol biopolymer transport system component